MQIFLSKSMSTPDDYWVEKADSLKKRGKFEESVMAYDKALQIKNNEKKPDYWYRKAMSHFELGQYEKATDFLKNDIKSNGPSFNTLFKLGEVFLLSKKYSEALENFNKAYEANYEKLMDHEDQAKDLKSHKKFEKALLHADIASKTKTIPSEFWHLKGVACYGLGKFDESLQCYVKSQENNNNNSELMFDISKSLLALDKKDECLNSLEEACKLNPEIRKRIIIEPVFEKIENIPRFRILKNSSKI